MANKLQKILAGVCLGGAVSLNGGCGIIIDNSYIGDKPLNKIDLGEVVTEYASEAYKISTSLDKTRDDKSNQDPFDSNYNPLTYKN